MTNKLSIISASLLIVMGLFVATTTSAQADGETATSSSGQATQTTLVTTSYVTRQETVCDTGAYGQQNCHVVFTQVPVHAVVNTGIDPRILAVLTGVAAASAMVVFANVRRQA